MGLNLVYSLLCMLSRIKINRKGESRREDKKVMCEYLNIKTQSRIITVRQ